MYAKLGKFIDIQTKLPKNLQRNVQNAMENLKNIMENLHYLECKNCGFKDDRDHVAVANITKKFKELLLNLNGLEGEGLGT
jgi:transposase